MSDLRQAEPDSAPARERDPALDLRSLEVLRGDLLDLPVRSQAGDHGAEHRVEGVVGLGAELGVVAEPQPGQCVPYRRDQVRSPADVRGLAALVPLVREPQIFKAAAG